ADRGRDRRPAAVPGGPGRRADRRAGTPGRRAGAAGGGGGGGARPPGPSRAGRARRREELPRPGAPTRRAVRGRARRRGVSGLGRFDELVVALRCVAPAGELAASAAFPATAAGPSLREVLIGSEGVLGVITELTVRVCPRPAQRRFDGWFFRSFAEGADAFAELEQRRSAPDVARLSDEDETHSALAFAASGGARDLVGRAYLRARGYAGGCLVVVGWDGTEEDVRRRRAAAARRSARRAMRSSPTAAPSPTTMRSGATTCRGCATRPGRWASTCCGPPRRRRTRPGS